MEKLRHRAVTQGHQLGMTKFTKFCPGGAPKGLRDTQEEVLSHRLRVGQLTVGGGCLMPLSSRQCLMRKRLLLTEDSPQLILSPQEVCALEGSPGPCPTSSTLPQAKRQPGSGQNKEVLWGHGPLRLTPWGHPPPLHPMGPNQATLRTALAPSSQPSFGPPRPSL